MKTAITSIFIVLSTLMFAQNNKLTWPREIKTDNYLITLYQPQPETFKGNVLTGRMAISIKNAKEEMTFGALWYEAKVSTDLDDRTATLKEITIPVVKFPDLDDETKLEQLKALIVKSFKGLDITMSVDKIISTLETVENDDLNKDFKNDAPVIYFRTEGSVLVMIDGEPKLKKAESSTIETVINSPFFIAKSADNYYLKGGDFWYTSTAIKSNSWAVTTKIPSDIKKLGEKEIEKSKENEDTKEDKSQGPPSSAKIIISTVPAELIIADGELKYEPIKNTSLLYVTNTESDIIMDITSQHHFILLNGRWYSSKSMKDGDWKFIEPSTLPKDFGNIPDSSAVASVRYSIPGTAESLEAKYEQYIPQTAEIDRKTATSKVTYDGKPQFEKIEGTDLSYAINTESSVLKVVAGKYYCVDNGVWFIASSAEGPWKVSDIRPDQVDKIPSSYPVYNLKYVYIYEATPEVVYVGYTPGYYNSYIYGGVVVYGTGYYYQPWYGVHYYPRPVTYGYGVHYNPYTGWGFSVGVSYGWMTVHAYHHHGYWGAHGYHHGYRHGYNRGYHHGYSHGARRGYAAGYAHGNRNAYQNRSNGVKRTGNYNRKPTTKPSTRPNTKPNTRPSTQPSKKPNNMYSDKKGNVHQRDKSGNWQQKNNKPSTRPNTGTPKTKPQTRPSTQPKAKPSTRPQTRPSTQPKNNTQQRSRSMEQQYQNRNRGNNNYQRQRSTPSGGNRGGSYGGGRSAPSRGGGGRRR